MTNTLNEYITELNQNYNNLGEDLLMIESVVLALRCENEFTGDNVESSLKRLMDYTEQHLGEIRNLAVCVAKSAV